MARTALITGITGQDGGYLTELLLEQGYTVHGMVRPNSGFGGTRLEELLEVDGNAGRVSLHNAELTDSTSLALLLDKTDPDEVYHLATCAWTSGCCGRSTSPTRAATRPRRASSWAGSPRSASRNWFSTPAA